MSLSHNDIQCLWWLLSQQIWTAQDLVRFGNYTGVISDIDRTVLLKQLHNCDILVKRERDAHGLLKKKKVVPEPRQEGHDVGPRDGTDK